MYFTPRSHDDLPVIDSPRYAVCFGGVLPYIRDNSDLCKNDALRGFALMEVDGELMKYLVAKSESNNNPCTKTKILGIMIPE